MECHWRFLHDAQMRASSQVSHIEEQQKYWDCLKDSKDWEIHDTLQMLFKHWFWDDAFIFPYYFSISSLFYSTNLLMHTSSLVAVRLMMIRSIILFFLSVCLQSALTSLVPWLVDFPITNRASNVGSTTKGRPWITGVVSLSKIIQEKYRRKT